MADVKEFDILEKVKIGLGITGAFQDETLMGYIEEVKAFLIDGGVLKEIVDSPTSAGIITRGVSDLWNYGSGGADFSPYFMQRAAQLVYKRATDTQEGGYHV